MTLVDAHPFEPGDDEQISFEELQSSERFRKWAPKKAPSGRIGETHYSPQELAEVWGVSSETIRQLFKREPDVLKIGRHDSERNRRKYVSMKIPQSVAERVHKRLSAVPK